MVDLRIVFAVVWFGLQIGLVATAGRRADGAFGFRMFPEASTMKVSLFREVADGRRVHVENGLWTDATHRRHFDWFERVRYWRLDAEMNAGYGSAAQLDRLQHALDDVASHLDGDIETRRLVAEAMVRRNGREPVLHTLVSHERELP